MMEILLKRTQNLPKEYTSFLLHPHANTAYESINSCIVSIVPMFMFKVFYLCHISDFFLNKNLLSINYSSIFVFICDCWFLTCPCIDQNQLMRCSAV